MVLISSRVSVVSEGGLDVGPNDGRCESVTAFFHAPTKASYWEKSRKSKNLFYLHCNNLTNVKSAFARCSDYYINLMYITYIYTNMLILTQAAIFFHLQSFWKKSILCKHHNNPVMKVHVNAQCEIKHLHSCPWTSLSRVHLRRMGLLPCLPLYFPFHTSNLLSHWQAVSYMVCNLQMSSVHVCKPIHPKA